METIGTPWMWTGFLAFVLAMLALDLGVFHRQAHKVSVKEAAVWSVVWVACALAFNALLWQGFGAQKGMEFLTGYLIEKALSVDNIFVFVLIFGAFSVPEAYQHRVLFWGILGALVMRAIFVGLGAALLAQFHWVLYLFGAFLLITGVKMLLLRDAEFDPRTQPRLPLLPRLVPAVETYHGSRLHGGAERQALCHAPAAGAGGRGADGRGLRRGQRARHLRGDRGSLHRLHEQHLRHPGPAQPLLPAGGGRGAVPPAEGGPQPGAGLRGPQDAGGGCLQDPRGLEPRRHRPAGGRVHRRESGSGLGVRKPSEADPCRRTKSRPRAPISSRLEKMGGLPFEADERPREARREQGKEGFALGAVDGPEWAPVSGIPCLPPGANARVVPFRRAWSDPEPPSPDPALELQARRPSQSGRRALAQSRPEATARG